MEKMYVDEYIKLIDDLAGQYHSRYWFSIPTASKSREVSKLFEDLYNFIYQHETFSKKKYTNFHSAQFFVIALLRSVRIWFTILVARLLFWKKVKEIKRKKNIYLLRSWFYPQSVNKKGEYADQFFGALPKYLKDKKKSVLIVGTVFANNYLSVIGKVFSAKGPTVVPLEYFISFLDPVRAFFDILKNRIQIKDKIYFMKHDVTDIVKSNINRDFTNRAFEESMPYYAMKNILKSLDIDTYIYTFENNPWEKVALSAFKTYSPATRTMGYQHTTVSLGKLVKRLGENEKRCMPLPDKIVTNGTITKDILIKYGNFPSEKLAVGCALRFNVKVPLAHKRNRKKKTILLTPTAMRKSAKILDVAYQAFKDADDYRIIVRTHPGFSFDRMKSHLKVFPKDFPQNFYSSTNVKVEDDIKQADFVLYDESSLSLNALLSGVPVIHIHTEPIISVDPLFDCRYLTKEAKNAQDIISAIEYFNNLGEAEFLARQLSARKYAENYLRPVSEEALKAFL